MSRMWTSERTRRPVSGEAGAELGAVTLGGDPAGVVLGGERRWLPVYSPGGYSWRPTAGDRVLVIKTGAEHEVPCVVGTAQKDTGLLPGEVRLSGGNSTILLGQRELALSGKITVNGEALTEYIRNIVVSMLSKPGG